MSIKVTRPFAPKNDAFDDIVSSKDWKEVALNNDGCSSGPAKYLAKLAIKRNYACLCVDHDFDYRYGWKYGTSRKQADRYLKEGIEAAGHPVIAQVVYRCVRMFGWLHYNKE